jgi:hypothetical protein
VEKTNEIRRSWIFKTRGLSEIDSFMKSTMQESIFNIKLMNWPRRTNNKTKKNMNGLRTDNRRESLIESNTILLREPTTDPSCFISSKRTISMKFVMENLFTRNNISTGRFGNKTPSVILKKRIKLITHSRMTKRI